MDANFSPFIINFYHKHIVVAALTVVRSQVSRMVHRLALPHVDSSLPYLSCSLGLLVDHRTFLRSTACKAPLAQSSLSFTSS